PRLSSVTKYGLFTKSSPVSNASSNIVTEGSAGRVFTMLVDRSLSAAMWLLALYAFLVLVKQGRKPWAVAVIAFSSLGLLLVQSYGGEAIFRVYLYSIAGCSILLAPFIIDSFKIKKAMYRFVATGSIAVVTVLVAAAGLQGYFGGWSYTVLYKSQLEQSRELLGAHSGGATIVTVAPSGWPERSSADYVPLAVSNSIFDRPLIFLKETLSTGFPDDSDIKKLDTLARNNGYPYFIVLPEQMNFYSDYFGLFKPGAIKILEEKLRASSNWVSVIDDRHTVVFKFVDSDNS
ncbi:MAG: hypothetical protein ACRCSF_00190, partial [Mycobacteriaceae bacterium]